MACDADAVHERVLAAGGKIAIAIKDEEYAGRGFCQFNANSALVDALMLQSRYV